MKRDPSPLTALFLTLLLAACSGDTEGLAPLDGGIEGGPPPENTLALCQDGQDNDGDSKTDCDDDDCAIFAVCAGKLPDGASQEAGPDAPVPDAALDTAALDTAAPDTAAPDTLAPDTLAPDTAAPDSLALDSLAPDSLAPDTLAPDTLAPDTLAPDTTSCGNSVCDVGESCDGRGGSISCISDCPGVTTGPPNEQYCWADGVCTGPGCP